MTVVPFSPGPGSRQRKATMPVRQARRRVLPVTRASVTASATTAQSAGSVGMPT